jgi:CheY-specific phosphatase CheX
MALCIDTETAVIDSIDESIREVFEMMAGASITRSGSRCRPVSYASLANLPNKGKAISVVMGLTGGLQGSLSISMDAAAAIRWTQSLIDHQATEIDQTVIDGVGELGNMVVGGAKRRLNEYELTMSLPSVVRADSNDIVFATGTTPLEVSYDYEGSIVTILIALQSQA